MRQSWGNGLKLVDVVSLGIKTIDLQKIHEFFEDEIRINKNLYEVDSCIIESNHFSYKHYENNSFEKDTIIFSGDNEHIFVIEHKGYHHRLYSNKTTNLKETISEIHKYAQDMTKHERTSEQEDEFCFDAPFALKPRIKPAAESAREEIILRNSVDKVHSK